VGEEDAAAIVATTNAVALDRSLTEKKKGVSKKRRGEKRTTLFFQKKNSTLASQSKGEKPFDLQHPGQRQEQNDRGSPRGAAGEEKVVLFKGDKERMRLQSIPQKKRKVNFTEKRGGKKETKGV